MKQASYYGLLTRGLIMASFFFISLPVFTQKGIRMFNNNVGPVLNNQSGAHNLFKATLVCGIKKGFSIGVGYGIWKDNPTLQYSLNTGLQWRVGRAFLSNYRNGTVPNDSRSRSQLVFTFSPMLSLNLSKGRYVYQELEPFYLGTPNAVYCDYKYSITLGTTFTTSPRGTYKNVATSRNRTQQDFMLAINLRNFNFTIYDDYFPVFSTFLQLGDNWDRFFTGGGFLRYRFNDHYTLHLYSEVYTGLNRANPFLAPDIISYRNKGRKWKLKNIANQNAKQEFFNSSWFIASLTYTGPQTPGNSSDVILPNFNVFVGSSAPWTMFSQNLIHSMIKYDDSNHLKLHYFLHRSNVPGNLEAGGNNNWQVNKNSIFFGGGVTSNISMP
ncbi:MAG: hypothetical protein QM731_01320 [Chitinophagaceae bacterium]